MEYRNRRYMLCTVMSVVTNECVCIDFTWCKNLKVLHAHAPLFPYLRTAIFIYIISVPYIAHRSRILWVRAVSPVTMLTTIYFIYNSHTRVPIHRHITHTYTVPASLAFHVRTEFLQSYRCICCRHTTHVVLMSVLYVYGTRFISLQ